MKYSEYHGRPRTLYLSGENSDFLDDPSSLFFQELLDDAVADSTCPNDCEFGISGHELALIHCVWGSRSIGDLQPRLFLSCFPSLLLPNPSHVDRSSATF